VNKFAQLKKDCIFVPTITIKHNTMTKREINTEAKIHHLARLEMMMLEERGIFISYKEAIKRARNK
jgi:hypothetical protein